VLLWGVFVLVVGSENYIRGGRGGRGGGGGSGLLFQKQTNLTSVLLHGFQVEFMNCLHEDDKLY